MDYNFAQFIKDSRKCCKYRESFIERIEEEIALTNTSPANVQFHLNKQAYLKRLEGAKFATITSQFKEHDKYNDELGRFLDSISWRYLNT